MQLFIEPELSQQRKFSDVLFLIKIISGRLASNDSVRMINYRLFRKYNTRLHTPLHVVATRTNFMHKSCL